MGKKKKILSVVATIIMILNFSACDIFTRDEEAMKGKVLAEVGDVEITRGQLDKYMANTLKEYEDQYGEEFEDNKDIKDQLKEERTKALEKLVERQIVFNIADDLNIKYTDEEVQNYVDETVQAIKDNWGEENGYVNYLSQYGYTKKSFEKYLKEDYVITLVTKELVKDISVTDEEVKKYYDENVDSFTVSEAGANVTHLLFRATEKDGEEAINKAKTDCEAARKLILEGKTFKDIEDSYNDTDYCKTENLGFQPFENNQSLVSEFVAGYVNLPENQLSELVKTSYGWHLILNTKIYKASDVQPFEIVKDSVTNTVLSSKKSEEYNKKLEKYEKELDVVRYEKRLKDI